MASSKESLSTREMELLAFGMQSNETPTKINYQKFAELAGFTKVKSATNAWNAVKNKILANVPATPTKSEETADAKKSTVKKSTVKKSTASKRKAAGLEESDGEQASPCKPKKPRSRTKKTQVAAQKATSEPVKLENGHEDNAEGLAVEDEEDDADSEGLMVKQEEGVKQEED